MTESKIYNGIDSHKARIIVCAFRFYIEPIGGEQVHLLNLTKSLFESGQEIKGFVFNLDGKPASYLNIVLTLEDRKLNLFWWIYSKICYTLSILTDLLKHRKRKQILWCRGFTTIVLIIPFIKLLRFLKLLDIAIVVDLCSIPWVEADIHGRLPLWKYLEKRVIIWGDYIRVLNQKMQKILINMGIKKKKIWIIPVGSETHSYRWQYTDSRKIVYIGSSELWQGLRVLLDAMKILRKSIPDLKLLIIGNSNKTWKEENIECLEKIPYHQLFKYYLTSDAFVIPRVSNLVTETVTPIKLIEAMSFGIPIVASDVGGISCIVENNKEAILAEPDSPQALAGGILKVISDHSLAKEIGYNARRKFKLFTWKKIAEKINYYIQNNI